MCNCGNKRNSFSQQHKVEAPKAQIPKPIISNTPEANFEYTGKTALTVVGNVTGKNYRFTRTGAVQIVDHRDAPGMKMIPVLKRIYQ
jgi:hypothetical protein